MNPDADVSSMEAPQRVAIGLLGPCMIAWTSNVFLTGICFSAFYHYTAQGHFSKDTLGIKMLASLVFLLTTAIAVCCAVSLFRWGTTQNRTITELWFWDTVDCLQPTLVGLVAFLTQGYFCRRAFLLFENRWCKTAFVTVVGFFMLSGFAGAIGVTYYDFYSSNPTDHLAFTWKVTEEIWLWSSTVVDVLNTSTLCFLLGTKVAGFSESTDNVLKKLIKLAVETASYTAFVALAAALVDAFTDPNSYYTGDITYVFWVPIPTLYCLSLFTTLKSRDKLAKDLKNTSRAVVSPVVSPTCTTHPKGLCPPLTAKITTSPIFTRPPSWFSDTGVVVDDLKYAFDDKQSWRFSKVGIRDSGISGSGTCVGGIVYTV